MSATSHERSQLLAADDDLEAEVDAAEADPPPPPRRLAPRRARLLCASAGAALGLAGLAGAALLRAGGGAAQAVVDQPSLIHHAASLIAVEPKGGTCRDIKKGDPCYFSVEWAKTQGVFQHPEWYKGLTADSSLSEFQLAVYKSGAANCTGFKPCSAVALEAKVNAHAKAAEEALAKAEAAPKPPPGPRVQTFYMYRAQSKATYALENINTADLAGALWYVHNEVIVATPRKYSIDRIKRYKVSVKNTWEFWNTHKRQFSAFVAYDAGGCTTPVCKDIYNSYGFIVGCQVQPLSVAAYMGRHQTNWQCTAGEDKCRSPIWYSLPGACPAKGIPNGKIDPDSTDLDVDEYKSPECVRRMPGGHCKAGGEPTGAPDCTYTYEEAGEIFLDELVGIEDYNEFWNTSFTSCARDRAEGRLPKDTECIHKKEYDPRTDKGVGMSFWDGKLDKEKCSERLDKARQLFKQKYPAFPEHLEEPACEFDMYYDNEFSWKINHTNAPASSWWGQRMSM